MKSENTRRALKGREKISQAPCAPSGRMTFQCDRTGGSAALHHRLMSPVPSGQIIDAPLRDAKHVRGNAPGFSSEKFISAESATHLHTQHSSIEANASFDSRLQRWLGGSF